MSWQMNLSLVISRWSLVGKNKNLILCIFSGLLLALPFSFPTFWIFAWVGFVPLFFARQGKSKTKAFLLAYLTGIIFWWGTIYWLVHVTFLGTSVLILYLALYFGIFGLFVSTSDQRLTTNNCLFLPCVWVILEYTRSHLLTGFPWALLGYSQQMNLPIIQISDITGAWGVSFVIMMINCAVYLVVSPCPPCVPSGRRGWSLVVSYPLSEKIKTYIAAILILLLTLGYGFFKLYHRPSTNDQRLLKVSVIQANIPQELKWEESARGFIIKKYLGLTAIAAGATPRRIGSAGVTPSASKPDLLIWPEAAVPVVLEEEPDYYNAVVNNVRQAKTPLLFGAVTARKGLYYNSACLLSAEGALLQRYDKVHLVPFGEYIPLKKVFPFLETIVPIGDITPGKKYKVFEIASSPSAPRNDAKFSVLICFEDLFPELSRRFVADGAQFLVNITNDAWYKKTSAAAQHFQASVFRAVENRVYLVRAANTGISGFIAPSGKVVSLVREPSGNTIFIDGISTQIIPLEKHEQTFYGKKGDFFISLLLFFVIYSMLIKYKHV
ncbi:MAG: apolipoprotein N-acyltransferase [Candidatus Omnitrophica bacterium]|nr:apolipoprotein N-acyltransferase [Candidatus Omnitrophota bacterium]